MKIFNIEIFQIIVIIFAVFAITRVIIQKKNKNFSLNEFLFWIIIWVGLVAVSFSKPYLDSLAVFLGFSRGVDILIYGGIIVLFYMIYRLYTIIDRQQQEITALVSKTAANSSKKKK